MKRRRSFWVVVLAFVAACLAGCGGGDEGDEPVTPPPAAQTQVINGISVPLSASGPDTSSLAGKDVNSNGVRDEVEISLARNYGDKKALHEAIVKLATFYQSWLQQLPSDQVAAKQMVEEELRLGTCVGAASGSSRSQIIGMVQEVSLRVFSTKERGARKAEIYRLAGPYETSETEAICGA